MAWTFMLIVLWLTNGLPEPHTVAIPQAVECTQEIAKQMWGHLAPGRDDVSSEFSWACEQADAPEAKPTEQGTPPAPPHAPKGDEA